MTCIKKVLFVRNLSGNDTGVAATILLVFEMNSEAGQAPLAD
jgi:hypothetical protein